MPFVLKRSLAKLPFEFLHFRWGKGYGHIISDLTDKEHMRKRATDLSSMISDYRLKNEDHRIYVVAKSAGTAVALMALSELPADTVDRAILLSPAVSPQFPLEKALRAVRRDLVSYWSPLDLFYLALGTSLFGTADGVYGKSAGLIGFAEPQGDQLDANYKKLRQVKWEPSMIRFLHPGTHFGTSMPPFIRTFVCSLLEY